MKLRSQRDTATTATTSTTSTTTTTAPATTTRKRKTDPYTDTAATATTTTAAGTTRKRKINTDTATTTTIAAATTKRKGKTGPDTVATATSTTKRKRKAQPDATATTSTAATTSTTAAAKTTRKRKTGTETFTIKCGLSTFSREPLITEKINEDVLEISDFVVESSLYINFIFNKKLYEDPHWVIEEKPRFLDYFYHLKTKSQQKYNIDPEYNDLRSEAGLKKYNGENRSNLFLFAAKQYETVLMNNITTHMYKRVRKFFKFVAPTVPNYETLDNLFNRKSNNPVSTELVSHLKKHLHFEFENFHDLDEKWYKYIPFLYRLQRFFESNEVRNFRIFPIFKAGRKHIRYDSFQFFRLLCSLKKQNQLTSWDKFKEHKIAMWSMFFNVKKFETRNHKFDYSFTTDGVSVCIKMNRLSKTDKAEKKKKRKENRKKQNSAKYASGEYGDMIGMDPGLKLMFGMVTKKMHEEESRGTHLKMKTSKFRHDAGEHRRKYKLKVWTKHLHDDVETDRHAQEVPISCMNVFYIEYTAFSLKHLKRLQQLYKQRKIARLKFEKYMCMEKTLHRYVKKILNLNDRKPQKKTLVFVGNPNISKQMKGYVRTPIRKLVAKLSSHPMCRVIDVDEFRTTKLCSQCFCEVHTSRSPHRFQVCPNCKTVWNRDINAANNILKQGLSLLLDNKPAHPNFRRNTTLTKS